MELYVPVDLHVFVPLTSSSVHGRSHLNNVDFLGGGVIPGKAAARRTVNSVIRFAVDALPRERDTYVFGWGIASAQYGQNAVVSDVCVRWEYQPVVKRVLAIVYDWRDTECIRRVGMCCPRWPGELWR